MLYKKNLSCLIFTALLLLFLSCKNTPAPVEPDMLPPEQELLESYDTTLNRAQTARTAALNVQGQVYFPDDWQNAESNYNAGRTAGKDTTGEVNRAIVSLAAAAEAFDTIAENAGPLYAAEMEEVRATYESTIALTGQSRDEALRNQGSVYFPEDWQAAEELRENGENANTNTIAELRSAISLLESAAEKYDDIAVRSRPLHEEREAANAALQAALTGVNQSRAEAQNLQSNVHFPDDWSNAEEAFQSAQEAPTDTTEEVNAAAALLVSAAGMYSDMAGRSRAVAERERTEAQAALTAATARADRSRQAAMDANGQTYFANEWRAAETRNTSARNARRTTTEEMQAAAALYVAAAEAYDDIARRSAPRLTADTAEANRALQAAVTRATQSRNQATAARGQTLFPNEWRTAESRNQTAANARRGTLAEIRAATPLYIAAADAYDDIVRRANEQTAQQSARTNAETARTNAETARQAAIDARAPVAVQAEYNQAETIFQQALRDFNGGTFAPALERFNQSTPLFTAAAQAATLKHGQAEDIVERARQLLDESIDLATTVGRALEEENE